MDAEAYILLVEDDEAIGGLVQTIIEEEFVLPVVVVDDGQKALDRVEAALPLAIVVDLVMPRLSGGQFMQEVRRRYGPELPLIVMSALSKVEIEDAAHAVAGSPLAKPFGIEELVRHVADALASALNVANGAVDQPKATPTARALRSDADVLIDQSWHVLTGSREHLSQARQFLVELEQTRRS